MPHFLLASSCFRSQSKAENRAEYISPAAMCTAQLLQYVKYYLQKRYFSVILSHRNKNPIFRKEDRVICLSEHLHQGYYKVIHKAEDDTHNRSYDRREGEIIEVSERLSRSQCEKHRKNAEADSYKRNIADL